jgi:hypothetical protein
MAKRKREKELPPDGGGSNLCCLEKFFMGFKECQEEVLQYLIETEGVDPKDSFCQRVSSHLDQTSSKFTKDKYIHFCPIVKVASVTCKTILVNMKLINRLSLLMLTF